MHEDKEVWAGRKGALGRGWTWLKQGLGALLLVEQELTYGVVMLSGKRIIGCRVF